MSSTGRTRTDGAVSGISARGGLACVAVPVLVVLVLAAAVGFNAVNAADGYLSPDSRRYLAFAQNLLDGRGLGRLNDGRGTLAFDALAIWPPGYPLLIALVAWVTGTSVFVASKLLSIAAAAAIAAMISRSLGSAAPAAAIVLLSASAVRIFSYSWSETVFLALMVAFALALAGVWRRRAETLRRFAIPVAAAALAAAGLAFTRYIGIFSIGCLGLLALALVAERRIGRAALVAAAVAVVAAAVVALLLHNVEVSGYATGQPRTPAPETNARLATTLAHALISEAVFPLQAVSLGSSWHRKVIVAQVVLLLPGLLALFRRRRTGANGGWLDTRAVCLIGVGLAYGVAIVVLRWTRDFDPFDYRLIGPAAILVLIGLVRAVSLRVAGLPATLVGGLAVLAAMSVWFNTAFAPVRPGGETYPAYVQALLADFAAVPPGAIVVLGEEDLLYTRPDLAVAHPKRASLQGPAEPLDDLLAELDPGRPVYLRVPDDPLDDALNPGVREAVARLQPGTLVRVRDARVD